MSEKTFGSLRISLSRRSISLVVEVGLSAPAGTVIIPGCSAVGGPTSNAIGRGAETR